MKTAFSILLLFHGLVHLLGFAKAFNLAAVPALSQPMSKSTGVAWLISAAIFAVAAILFFEKKEAWWLVAAMGFFVSQNLIINFWPDAKFGTIPNLIILLAVVVGFGTWRFFKKYDDDVKSSLLETAALPDSVLTEADLRNLPLLVQKYIRQSGAVGKPKVVNFKISFTGKIRKNEQSPWMPFTSEQFNFMDTPTRLFFMKANMKNLPISGYHCFKNGDASMDIRLLSLLKVQFQSGKEMNVSETVTFFNDMCCMAPATLVDRRISWLESGENKVKAAFTNNGTTITAWLFFNEKGELEDFISDDRFAADENGTMKKLPWATPLKAYKTINGHRLAGSAETIYTYPEGSLIYGTFQLTNVEYNLKSR